MKRPLPIHPKPFRALVKDLTLVERGALITLAVEFWENGEPVPVRSMRRHFGSNGDTARRLGALLGPHFEPGSYFALLRAAHVAKARRKAKAARASTASRMAKRKARADAGAKS